VSSKSAARLAIALFVLGSLSPSGAARGGEFREIAAEALKTQIQRGDGIAVVDVQSEEEFREHHFEGALPAGSGVGALERIARTLSRSKGDIVVSPRGGKDAVRAAQLLVERGIARKRLAALREGMQSAMADRPSCDCCRAEGPGSGRKSQ
jgi:rhodanese-related sulfurtransferase